MTVGMLKELIKNIPDDYRLILDNGKCVADDHNEVIFAVAYKTHGKVVQPKVLVLQTKDDIDVIEEIESTFKYYREENPEKPAREIFAELSERGFNRNDYMKCSDWLKDTYRYSGLDD